MLRSHQIVVFMIKIHFIQLHHLNKNEIFYL
jgi:hypothetical protein